MTLIANYVPLQAPDGGPNFYEFGDDVLYAINIDNDKDGDADIIYQFQFTSEVTNPNTFLYNTGPITSLESANWNRRQTYSVTRVDRARAVHVLGSGDPLPALQHRAAVDARLLGPGRRRPSPHSATGSPGLRRATGRRLLRRPRRHLRPRRPAALRAGPQHLRALEHRARPDGRGCQLHRRRQRPQHRHPGAHQPADRRGGHTGQGDRSGRRSSGCGPPPAARRPVSSRTSPASTSTRARSTQVSRLGNPLVNEVLIPMGTKDYWNAQPPSGDSQFASHVATPELAGLLPVLYPGVFPNLAAFNNTGTPRADLLAILLTGIPAGVVPGFQNFTGPTQADMLRLNLAIPPATSGPSNLGLVGGDPAGYPNGRRVFDDVATIELRAIAGATLPLVDPSYTPDAAAGAISMGLTSGPTDLTAMGTENYLPGFPYLGLPLSGFVAGA